MMDNGRGNYNETWQLKKGGEWTWNKNEFKNDKNFKVWVNKIENNYVLGNTMGDPSAHGVVYHYTSKVINTNQDLFVLKTVKTKNNQPLVVQLQKEAFIGMIPNAPVPTVMAHRYIKTTHVYEILMRNVMKDTNMLGNKKISSMQNFIKHPRLYEDVIRKFHDVLVEFYKTTHHFHGDLHLGNIIVTHDANWNIDTIYIIDLGSVVPFPKSLNKKKTQGFRYVSDFMEPMTKAYNSLTKAYNFTSFNKNTKQHGNIVWLHKKTSVIHNLKQKQNNKFWMDVLAIGKSKKSWWSSWWPFR
jgi:hypothetical protein